MVMKNLPGPLKRGIFSQIHYKAGIEENQRKKDISAMKLPVIPTIRGLPVPVALN
jgi:hypothetical protein